MAIALPKTDVSTLALARDPATGAVYFGIVESFYHDEEKVELSNCAEMGRKDMRLKYHDRMNTVFGTEPSGFWFMPFTSKAGRPFQDTIHSFNTATRKDLLTLREIYRARYVDGEHPLTVTGLSSRLADFGMDKKETERCWDLWNSQGYLTEEWARDAAGNQMMSIGIHLHMLEDPYRLHKLTI